MIARSCLPGDIAAVQAQPEQMDEHEIMIGQAQILAWSGFALSFWQDTTCIGCLGVAPLPLGSGHAWALFSKASGPSMPWITKHARQVLDLAPYRRIQTTVITDFTAGHRWLRLLAFEMEAERMRCYDNAGRDHALYARVRT